MTQINRREALTAVAVVPFASAPALARTAEDANPYYGYGAYPYYRRRGWWGPGFGIGLGFGW